MTYNEELKLTQKIPVTIPSLSVVVRIRVSFESLKGINFGRESVDSAFIASKESKTI